MKLRNSHINHNHKNTTIFTLLIAILLMQSCQVEMPDEVEKAYNKLDSDIDFNFDVKPILSDKCFACHGPDLTNNKGDLRLDIAEVAYKPITTTGNRAIVPSNPSKSALVDRILSHDEEFMMPPTESNLKLNAEEKAILVKWIEKGAEYKKHWAFIVPEKIAPPKVSSETITEIDNFIFKTLEDHKLSPKKEADKETLIRRVSFDLTGLPPTIDEIDDFINDNSTQAYEKVVERLMASPRYGEKMAEDWMDLARFADTHGYSVDRYRPMWPWRDWVIEAFNINMPYNQFVTWQLAGDLLPNATKEQILATGFNRNHPQNMEGGIVNEEFRVEYVADRTNTFGTAFLALSLECARCHDHKYDPISQKEYFELSSFFNQIDEAGQISWDNAMPVPTMLLTDDKQDSIINYLNASISAKENGLEQINATSDKDINLATQLNHGLQAYFDFENAVNRKFANRRNASAFAKVTEVQPWNENIQEPELVNGKFGKAIKLNGDDPLTFGDIGVFSRAEPFSINYWVKIPEELESGTMMHKGQGAIIYNFRGYHLALRDNKMEAMLAHTVPYNAIIKISEIEIPKNEWLNITMTYTGNSKASGLKVFLNGEEVNMITEKDKLYKDIIFPEMNKQPGLRFGARWRGIGTKDTEYDEIRIYNRTLTSGEIKKLFRPGYLPTNDELDEIKLASDPNYQQELKKLIAIRKEQNALIESIPEIMVMDEVEEKRKTYLLERGAYDAHGEEVSEGTIDAIMEFSDEYPKNRLGLTQWLFSDKNPITARVVVNRIWQSFFGTGLVSSTADFGNQGKLPSHPELMDWLSADFIENGWDLKRLQKQIVMSAAYRQSSISSTELKEIDYDNTLISRGPSSRLSAEMMRDNALASSGLLVNKIGGESVKPYQPDGLWRINGSSYQQDKGEKLYRRSMYTYWKRTVPPPTMNTFDAPTRSYCVVKRQKTSTPLQSLALLNDPQFVEASRVIAQESLQKTAEIDDQINYIYRSFTSKKPKADELKLLKDFYLKQLEDFSRNVEAATGWLAIGESAVLANNKTELAALTVTASMILNSDAAMMKR